MPEVLIQHAYHSVDKVGKASYIHVYQGGHANSSTIVVKYTQFPALPGRLMAGRMALNHLIGVRIPAGQHSTNLMKQYTYILLDWDGCLAKTLDIVLAAYKKIFAQYAIFPEDKVITQEVFGDWDGPKKLGVTDIKAFTEKFVTEIDKTYPQVDLYDGVPEVLRAFKNMGKKMALLTSSRRSTVEPALRNNNLTDMFDIILAAEDVYKSKPDPEIIFKALKELNGTKDQAIIIGDSKSDLQAATNAGIDSILFFPEHNKSFYDLQELETYKPTYTVHNFKDILEKIS